MGFESELKYTVRDKDIFTRVAGLQEIDAYRVRDKGFHFHRDTYFDTEDRRLLKAKVVFRHREQKKSSILTFKAPGKSGCGFYHRIEIEAVTVATPEEITGGNLPDLTPVKEAAGYFGNESLTAALSVANNRRILELSRQRIPRFEIALDDVTFAGPGGTAHVMELEVESVAWEDEDLKSVGEWLTGRFDLFPAGPSKYILGMELVGEVTGRNIKP
ncbi:MAG: CYTH domain-containing protein [Candidatus Latescibacterota bacterium]